MNSVPLGGAINWSALLSQLEGNDMSVTALLADPTVTATAGPEAMLGKFSGRLYLHLTDSADTNWLNLSALGAGIVRTARRVIPYTAFTGAAAHESDVEITDLVPVGAKIVGARLLPTVQFAAPGISAAGVALGADSEGSSNVASVNLQSGVVGPLAGFFDPFALNPASLWLIFVMAGNTCENLTAGQFTLQVDYLI